ncbi:hypothetical protein [Rhizobium leguminosarum]|uniref:hypothetical protein n=1 Tax=Rhizobium leguminosarum TaxID=384 RepID=UPI0013BAF3ED|nr:hypothetical protein [Rhizobium leguminosarum]NEI66482.1 hypothetical protein [Rhizobium leguminosarum]
MKAEDINALKDEFETFWRDDFASLPDGLGPLVRNFLKAMDGLNDHKSKDRRMTWVDVSFRHDGKDWKAFATPRVDRRKWNAVQALQLVAALDVFNREAVGKALPAGGRSSLEELTDLAHKELDAIRDGKLESDTGTSMAVWAFVERWIAFGKELDKPEAAHLPLAQI